MSFPSSHATVYRNEVGEVLFWDEPSYGADQDEWYDRQDAADADGEALWDAVCDIVSELVTEEAGEYTTDALLVAVANSCPQGWDRALGSHVVNKAYLLDALSEVQAVQYEDNGTWGAA